MSQPKEMVVSQWKAGCASSAWYKKEKPTFNGALPALRRLLWNEINSSTSEKRVDMI